MQRREFLKLIAAGSSTAALAGCTGSQASQGTRVLVLAFDGMDPRIVQALLDQGKLPNYARLAAQGSFSKLATSTPPHTPVAFASIITGTDPGKHHIFDFIHRDPNPAQSAAAVRPHFSTAEAIEPESQWTIPLGGWKLPLASDATQLLRRGRPFWEHLIAAGVDADIYYLPSNYPVQQADGPGRFRSTSGMGTPDLLGGYGEFTLFSPDVPLSGRQASGGRFTHMPTVDHRAQAELSGPPNFLLDVAKDELPPPMTVPFEILRDPSDAVAKLKIGEQVLLLRQGEWSGWLPVDFSSGIPGGAALRAMGAPTSVRGMVQLYMKQVHPKLIVYASPINIDPLLPVTAISSPADFAARLADKHGRFATLGIPEDTKALSHGALSEQEFLQQSDLTMQERIVQYRDALAHFRSGCLFFYLGATDLVQHMFWRDRDPEHPGRQAEQADQFGQVIEDLYISTDDLVGDALEALEPEDTLIVLSDHGFTSFRRGFNLNTWLLENDFLALRDPLGRDRNEMLTGLDWSRTQAYGLGMNSLYLNLAGREKYGQVKSKQQRGMLESLREKLMQARDQGGSQVFHHIDLTAEIYPEAEPNIAPDLVLGYADGYRASWDTVLGKLPLPLIEDNLDRWSGTHLIAADLVPGMLFCNHKITQESPTLTDIAPTILAAFGLAPGKEMTGRSLLVEGGTTNEHE